MRELDGERERPRRRRHQQRAPDAGLHQARGHPLAERPPPRHRERPCGSWATSTFIACPETGCDGRATTTGGAPCQAAGPVGAGGAITASADNSSHTSGAVTRSAPPRSGHAAAAPRPRSTARCSGPAPAAAGRWPGSQPASGSISGRACSSGTGSRSSATAPASTLGSSHSFSHACAATGCGA